MSDWIALVVSIMVCMGAAFIGGLLTSRAIPEWYRSLKKPSWNPPEGAFGPIWSILYILMAVSLWLVWEEGGFSEQALPIIVFAIQLILNVAWSWIFFYKRMIFAGVVEMAILWSVILATMGMFWVASSIAAILLIPYIVWVSIACYLNYTILKLNVAV